MQNVLAKVLVKGAEREALQTWRLFIHRETAPIMWKVKAVNGLSRKM